MHPINSSQNKLLSSPTDICNEWKLYFKDLYTPNSNGYNDNFKQHIEAEVDEMYKESLDREPGVMKTEISICEIVGIIKQMKSNKAPGVDGITTECFKYGGEMVIKCLFYLFNLLKDVEYVPKKF